MKGTGEILGDIVSSTGEIWNADRFGKLRFWNRSIAST